MSEEREMPYVPRTPEILAMYKSQPEVLRNPASRSEDRVFAFYAITTMEWATNDKITMADIGMNEKEANELSLKYPVEFKKAMDKFSGDQFGGKKQVA